MGLYIKKRIKAFAEPSLSSLERQRNKRQTIEDQVESFVESRAALFGSSDLSTPRTSMLPWACVMLLALWWV
jgi:hypothetical protein